MTTKEKAVNNYGFYEEDSNIENLTAEELKKMELVLVKELSKKECSDKNINVSLIALNELRSIGFNNDVSILFLSKLIEDVYHERKVYEQSDYFDLSTPENEHYKELANYYQMCDEQFYRVMVAKAIGDSKCETKNINDIVYGIVSIISNKIKNNNTLKLEA